MGRFLILVLKRITKFGRELESWIVSLSAFVGLITFLPVALDLEDQMDERTLRAWEFLLEHEQTAWAFDSGKSELKAPDTYTSQEGEIEKSSGAVYRALELLNREFKGRLCAPWLIPMFQYFTGSTSRQCFFPSQARESLAQRYLQSVNLVGIELAKADLEKTDFSYADLSEANLKNANLLRANLKDAKLFNANLKNANLSRANLKDTRLYKANLKNADLSRANLKDAKLQSANLKDAKLQSANLKNADLSRANLENARLVDAALVNSELFEACMKDANLTDAELNKADLRKTDLTNANLNFADLSNTDFENTNVTNANMTGVIGLTAKQLKESCVSDPETPPKLQNQHTVDWNNQICGGGQSACERWKNGN